MSLRALRLTCTTANARLTLHADEMFHSLCMLIGASSALRPRQTARQSQRLVTDAATTFAREWTALLRRGEALHHALACVGQDSRDLTVAKLRGFFNRWGPWPLIDRASPVYSATLLMEVCRARGVREHVLIAAASHLIFHEGADPSARPPPDYRFTCSPLILAACRGLPKLTAFLLVCGAEALCVGEGRFRLCGKVASIAGKYSALEWTERLIAAEAAAGVAAQQRQELEVCRCLLLLLDGAPPSGHPRTWTSASEAHVRMMQMYQLARVKARVMAGGRLGRRIAEGTA